MPSNQHYILMSGSRGCLPDYCSSYESREDAVFAFTLLFGLKARHELVKRLKRDNYVVLPKGWGSDYVEIQECDCHTPEVHND